MTYGQSPSGQARALSPATTAVQAGDISNEDAAKQALLRARQALAQSDLQKAQQLLEQVKTIPADFDALGDSPATIESLIQRQNQLVDLAEARSPEYNSGAASFFLVQAEALMYYQDFDNAEALIKHARGFNVEFNDKIGDPDRLEKLLELSRASLKQQASTGTQVAAVATAAKGNKDVAEMRKLMSQAQLAFDKGQYQDAAAFVTDAKSLSVEDESFASGETRPWQLELKIQNALGGAPEIPTETATFDAAVQQTTFDGLDDENVAQASYDPAEDNTKVVQVASFTDVRQDDGRGAIPQTNGSFAPIPSSPMDFYRSGLKALSERKTEDARNYLVRAWEGRDQLDGVTQQSIQDQLTRLNIKNPTAKAATANLQGRGAKDVEAFRQLQAEVFRERVTAEKLIQESPRDALERMAMIRNRIGQSKLDASQQSPLLKMIDRDMEEVQAYIEENISEIETNEQNAENKAIVQRRRQRRIDVDNQLQSLVEDYNRLIDEKRFPEAKVIASQARDLAPKSEIAVLLDEKVKIQQAIDYQDYLKNRQEGNFLDATADVQLAAGSAAYFSKPVFIEDAETFTRNGERRRARAAEGRYDSEAEAMIWNQLKNERVQGDYRGTLNDALDQLATTAGVNIIMDEVALSASNILTDTQVNVPIRSPISLKSALEIILQQKGLVFEVDNEVIKVTTPEAQSSSLQTETLYIGDLIMPMEPPRNPMSMDFMSPRTMGAMGGSMNVQNTATAQPSSQLAMAQQMGGMTGSNGMNPMGQGNYLASNSGPQRGTPIYGTMGSQQLGGVTLQDFQPLLELIQSTIDRDTWELAGGSATIQPYVQNLSLVVSAPQETQDKIQDLLRKLRELNDVQIVVEVRFVTLADNFFERVGIDFDFNINDNSGGLVTNANGDQFLANGSSGVIGRQNLDPFTPTTDLDVGFLQQSFTAAQPLFGGFTAGTGASLGFAILSDIEVFFLIEASKGNTRTNITQAPTVTMFNGQSASVSDFASRPFVTSVIPVVGDFAVAHQPIITLLPDGTNLNVSAVVSSDRQFVRLKLVPFFTQVTEVSTFTFNGSQETERTTDSVLDDLLDIVDGGTNADDSNEELLTRQTGITVQLPVLAQTNVSTVVSVPDGGTVLMGGIKRMREGRQESGVPFLSNIPYVNRLFKNVGIGHETQHLMMMVTPRIIIQKEIEEDHVGGS
jgi:general secretion pathway protein D